MTNAGADRLAASYGYCRDLHRAYGRTYYLATRLLPAGKRRHVHALYGFTRYTDEIVDALDGSSVGHRAARLRAWSDRFAASVTVRRSTIRCCRPSCTPSTPSAWSGRTSRRSSIRWRWT